MLELIAHSLHYKAEQNNHPQPVGSTETGAVEQGEGGKEGTSEGDKGGEGELPFPAG